MHRCSRCTRLMCHCEEQSDAAISGRHWHPTPATMKTVCTDCVCSGGQRPPLAVTGFCAPSPTVQCPQICHCEAPTGPWQSREGSYVFAGSILLSTPVLRDCHGRFAPRNDKSGDFTVLTAACTDRYCVAGRGMPLPYSGAHHLTTAGTGCKCLPEIATSLRSSQ